MKKYILFLHGTYAAKDIPFYRSLCRGRRLVAVDGGFNFFRKTKLTPEVLIGDFDSIARVPADLPVKTKVVRYPQQKNKTDAELAVDYCISAGAGQIELVQPSFGEPDQFFGNLMLLSQYAVRRRNPSYVSLTIVNRSYRAFAVMDGRYWVEGSKGDIVSVIPLSDAIKLSWSGTQFDVQNIQLTRGDSRSLRNVLGAGRAEIRIAGLALLIHQVSPSSRRK